MSPAKAKPDQPMGTYTDFLYARPSFLEGAARLFDFAGTLNEYNHSLTPQQADRVALTADWEAVGEDMRQAMQQFAASYPELQLDVAQG